MAKRFREARKQNNLKLIDAAKLLGISQPTLSAWEAGRKSPSLEGLKNMSELYGLSTDYLLGLTDELTPDISKNNILSEKLLSIMNGQPVYSQKYGWCLVHKSNKVLILSNGEQLPLSTASTLYSLPLAFTHSPMPAEVPLPRSDIKRYSEVWVEPISADSDLRMELRGWYKVRDRWVENEFGNRFYLDTYENKWIAFENILLL